MKAGGIRSLRLLFALLLLLQFLFAGAQTPDLWDSTTIKKLRATLAKMFEDSMNDRILLGEMKTDGPYHKRERAAINSRIRFKDSVNSIKLSNILNQYGWLGAEQVGLTGNYALFFALKYSNLKTMKKFLPVLQDAVRETKAQLSQLAEIEDLVNIRQYQRQVYGTQFGRDQATGNYFIYPIARVDSLDIRRAQMGLDSMSIVTKAHNIKWNPLRHEADVQSYEKQTRRKWKK